MQIDNSMSMLPLETPAKSYQIARIAHWDEVASQMKKWKGWGGLYHRRLTEVYRSLIPPSQRVIEIGCGDGDLLAAMQPSYGVGVDFSGSMIQSAKIAILNYISYTRIFTNFD